MDDNSQSYVGVCHSLKIYPVEKIDRFFVWGSRACFRPLVEPEEPRIVPGSLKYQFSQKENEADEHVITYNIAQTGAETIRRHGAGAVRMVVATFVDAHGNCRVIGSQTYPARLTVGEAEGMSAVKIVALAPGLLPVMI